MFYLSLYRDVTMPIGDKSAYTAKQKRQAQHIYESEKNKVVRMKMHNVLLGRP